jgi:hypothetical protein
MMHEQPRSIAIVAYGWRMAAASTGLQDSSADQCGPKHFHITVARASSYCSVGGAYGCKRQ